MQERGYSFNEVVYFTPTALEKAGGFWPLRLGRNIAKPHYHMGPKYVTHYSLHFVLEGCGTFVQNDRSYPLKKGDMICLFPMVSNEYWTDRENVLELAWISFQGKQALPILHRIGLRPYSPHLPQSMNEVVIKLVEQLCLYFQLPGNDAQDLQRDSTFLQFFHTLSTLFPAANNINRNDAVTWLQKGLEFLEMHYMEGITINEAAKYAGVNRAHFSKQFQKCLGISPSEFLKSLIMKEAGRMVKETNHSFTEIALSVGFPDLYSFSKTFKKFYGVSPTMSRSFHK